MHSIESQLKYFSVKVNNGSGCIFQPHTSDYTYVLTVKHNLIIRKGKYFARVNRFNLEEGSDLKVKEIFVHPDSKIDLALILVEYIGNSDYSLMYSKHEKNETVRLFGYPEINKNASIKTSSFQCKCDLEYEPDISFRIISDSSFFTFNRGSAQNVIGFSGCGIFYEEGEQIILKGIFPELNYPDGAYNALIAYQIECFDPIIKENNLQELVPEFLLNFNHYKDLAFYSFEPHISGVIKENLEKIITSNISPNQIADLFKGELYIPFTEKYKNKLINKTLWKGWLELLTVLSIIAEDVEDEVDNITLLNTYLQKIKLLFSIDEPALSILIKKLISDQQLKRFLINDICIVINSTIEPSLRIHKKSSIKRIIANISRANIYDRGRMIDDTANRYSFSCLHLSHFLNEIGTIEPNYEENIPVDISQIKSIIKNIISNLND